MGRILKIDDAYFVEFLGNGLKFRKKAGHSREEAEQKLASIEESMRLTALDVDVSTVTVHLFVQRFLVYAANIYPPKTFHRLESALKSFSKWVSDRLSSDGHLKEITPRVLNDYQSYLVQADFGLKTHWINFELFLLETIFGHAIKLGWLNDNPTLHVRDLSETKPRIPSIYGADQLQSMQEELPQGQRSAFALMHLAGLTLDEISVLTWEDVDWEKQTLRIRPSKAGHLDIRIIPMDYRMKDVLENHRMNSSSRSEIVFEDLPFASPFNQRKLFNSFVFELCRRGVTLQDISMYLNLDDLVKIYPYRHFISNRGI